jgi:hypothetical protein
MQELQIEWGLTTEQFNNESYADLLKIIEFRNAKNLGQKHEQERNMKKNIK